MIWQLFCHKRVICASPTFVIFAEDTLFNKVFNIFQRRICRAFSNLGPLAGSEFTEEAVELHVDDFALAIVHYQVAVALPEAGFGEDGGERFFRGG